MSVCSSSFRAIYVLLLVVLSFVYIIGYWRYSIGGIWPHHQIKHIYDKNKLGIAGSRVYGVEKIIEQRNDHLKQACRNLESNRTSINHDAQMLFNTYVDKKHGIAYCAIQKAASSYWKRILQFLQQPKQYLSPYDIRLYDIKIPRLKNMNPNETDSDKFFRFSVIRDPYDRLFSGYIDKLFSINTIYWSTVGTFIIRLVRRNHQNNYGHDVTFPEFIKYIVLSAKRGYGLDRHFSPIHKHCSPCQIDYDVIVKVENNEEEFRYILKILAEKTNVSINVDLYTRPMPTKSIEKKLTNKLYRRKPQLEKMMTFFEAMKRVWRCLQIIGILGKNVSLPFTQDNASEVRQLDFEKAIGHATEVSGDPASRKQNKRDAMIEEYSAVPVTDLLLLQQVVKKDCDLFEYNGRPDHIFNRTGLASGGSSDISPESLK